MSAIIVMILMLALSIVNNVSGACIHVPNNDMIEYSCNKGDSSDLNVIPARTEKIQISNMQLSHITRDTFSRFGDNLWVLACSNCGIIDISPDAFKSLTSLQQLRLDNNKLHTVRASWFEGLKYLTYLDLNYNQIETIENGVFINLPGLVDLRISGNKLQCLNVDELSKLPDLQRMFINRNAEFKCPNAISKILEEKQIEFERDPEWNKIVEDLIRPDSTTRSSQYVEWPTSSSTLPTPSTTAMHRERLIITRPTEPPTRTTVSYPTFASHPIYSESTKPPQWDWPSDWWPTSSTPSPTSTTSRTIEWPSAWWPPSTTTPKPNNHDMSSTNSIPLYNEQHYYPPEVPTSSNPNLYQQTNEPTATMTRPTMTPPISWSDGIAEIFNDFPTLGALDTIYPPEPIQPTEHQKDSENYQMTEHGNQSPMLPLENYQRNNQVAGVTVTPTNIQALDKPLPKCNNSSSIVLSFGIFVLTIFLSISRTC